jgi:hypothetical protein
VSSLRRLTEILSSGIAANEAAVIQRSMESDLGPGRRARLMRVPCGISDNAARATTNKMGVLKQDEVDAVRKIIAGDLDNTEKWRTLLSVIKHCPPKRNWLRGQCMSSRVKATERKPENRYVFS